LDNLGSLGIAMIKPFWHTDFTETTEKELIFKVFPPAATVP
jgi:hypothetical protein